jgi:hypothetical protein
MARLSLLTTPPLNPTVRLPQETARTSRRRASASRTQPAPGDGSQNLNRCQEIRDQPELLWDDGHIPWNGTRLAILQAFPAPGIGGLWSQGLLLLATKRANIFDPIMESASAVVCAFKARSLVCFVPIRRSLDVPISKVPEVFFLDSCGIAGLPWVLNRHIIHLFLVILIDRRGKGVGPSVR